MSRDELPRIKESKEGVGECSNVDKDLGEQFLKTYSLFVLSFPNQVLRHPNDYLAVDLDAEHLIILRTSEKNALMSGRWGESSKNTSRN